MQPSHSMLQMRKKGRGGRGPGRSRRAGQKQLLEGPTPVARMYTTTPHVTPDYLLHWRHDDGRHALIVGDARYTQVRPDDGPEWGSPASQKRLQELKAKATVVNLYASKSWLMLEDGRIVDSDEDLGLMIYPGPAESAEWLLDEVDSLFPLPLWPGENGDTLGVAEADQAAERLLMLLGTIRETAVLPKSGAEQAIGPFRYG